MHLQRRRKLNWALVEWIRYYNGVVLTFAERQKKVIIEKGKKKVHRSVRTVLI
jgi:hypothetical protein